MSNENLNEHLVKGLVRNPQSTSLITSLFDWGIHCREFINSEALLNLLYRLVITAKPKDCVELEQKTARILHLTNRTYHLLRKLQKISLMPSTFMKELLAVLYTTNKEDLAALSELSSIARLDDFKKVVNYVSEAKKQDVPLKILISQAPKETPIETWLKHSLETIKAYSTQALSYKILKEGRYSKEKNFFARISALNKFIKNSFAAAHPKAINLLIASYIPVFQKEQENPLNRAVIKLLSNLFRPSQLALVNECVAQITPEALNPLFSQCLFGLISQDSSYNEASEHLLYLLCQTHSETNTEIIVLIKTRLSEQDLSLLKDKKLIDLAKEILKPDTLGLRNGAWIQHLLGSPDFIAAADSHLLQILVRRYRLILMTLKQVEFEQLTNRLRNIMTFSSHHHRSITRFESVFAKDILINQRLLERRERLLKFRSEDCVWSVFKQLEKTCSERKNVDPQVVNKALTALYSYYNNGLTSLRADLLFKITYFIISTLTTEQEAFRTIETELTEWLNTSKPPFHIYNSAGQKIGFISETNYAMTFINELPCSLLDLPNTNPGMILYDQKGSLLGRLTINGEVKQVSPLLENISILLLSKLPVTYLEQSSVALGLLINHLFMENALAKLYENSTLDKHEWLSRQINTHLISNNKLLEKEIFEAAVKYQSSPALFILLANIRVTTNAEHLFTALLANSNKRQELFHETKQEAVFSFLSRHNGLSLITKFLITQQDRPWLEEGLQLFVHFAQNTNQPDLIFKALDLLKTHKDLPKKQFNTLLTTLLNSEACATIIWRFVLKASSLDSLQQVNQERAERFASFFSKQQCSTAVATLNEQNNWILCSYQYRLVLLILAKQCEQLFSKEARELSERIWSSEELKQMSLFIKKHFAQRANPDKNFAIGKALLEKLLFKCANLGQTHLFYREGEFDPAISLLKLERSQLKTLAADFSSNLKVSLISAFLINYTGSQQSLDRLLSDYVNNKLIRAKPEHLHAISFAMAKLPQRDFSICVFNKLEELITCDPASLDRKLLADMAEFYAFRTHKNSLKSPNAELQILRHFGQQKKYELIVQSCELLESEVADSNSASLLREITTQAKIESKLSKHLSHWYYPLYQFFVRLWSYEATERSHTRLYIPFCNENTHYFSSIKIPNVIKTPTQEFKLAKNNQTNSKTRYQLFLESLTSMTQLSSVTKGPSFFKSTTFPCHSGTPQKKEQKKISSPDRNITLT